MRTLVAGSVLLGCCGLVGAQLPKPPDPRYGLTGRVEQFPQGNPKAALKSALALIENGDYAYLVAHVLEPKMVDELVAARSKAYEAEAERELAQLRDFQRANPDKIAVADRVPLDPKEFRVMAAVKARDRGFKQLQRDIADKLRDDPQALKDMRRLAREGTVAEADPAATVSHEAVKGRTLYLKKVGDRWFLENRTSDEKKDP
jgi:hypothetical protein